MILWYLGIGEWYMPIDICVCRKVSSSALFGVFFSMWKDVHACCLFELFKSTNSFGCCLLLVSTMQIHRFFWLFNMLILCNIYVSWANVIHWYYLSILFFLMFILLCSYTLNPERIGGDFKEEVQVYCYSRSWFLLSTIVRCVFCWIRPSCFSLLTKFLLLVFQVHSGFLSAYDSVRIRILSLLKMAIGFV